MTHTSKYEWLLLIAIAVVAFLLCCVANCRAANYLLAFHTDNCQPCAAMEPVEAGLRAEGIDLRTYNAKDWPQGAAYYRVARFPTYCYVLSTPRGDFDSGARIVGMATPGQLRRLAKIPRVTTVGAATRSAVRGLFCPIILCIEL